MHLSTPSKAKCSFFKADEIQIIDQNQNYVTVKINNETHEIHKNDIATHPSLKNIDINAFDLGIIYTNYMFGK